MSRGVVPCRSLRSRQRSCWRLLNALALVKIALLVACLVMLLVVLWRS